GSCARGHQRRREALSAACLVTPLLRGYVQHDFAYHASLPEQLVRLARLGQGKSLRYERLDLLLFEEVKQGGQILSKPFRLQPFERLDAVGDHASAAREKPTGHNVEREDGGSTKALTTTRTS